VTPGTATAAGRPQAVWHVTVDGEPACSSPLLRADERLELPVCGSRHRPRAEEYAAFLRSRHPGAVIAVVAEGCPARGE
jgi:hypothetical protein